MAKHKLSRKTIKNKFSCEPCAISSAISVYTNICNRLDRKKCKEITEKLSDDKISMDKAFSEIKKLARGHKRETALLNYVDRLLKEG